jgi:hypothetical protein
LGSDDGFLPVLRFSYAFRIEAFASVTCRKIVSEID